MKFNPEVLKYLKGEKLSVDFKVSYDKQNGVPEKLEVLKTLFSNKSVIHLGFADHLEIIPDKIKGDNWVHKKVEGWSEFCIGVDINEEAVSFLQKNYGYKNLYCHNILNEQLLPAITERHWDYIYLGEVLEHIDNPVMFISEIRKLYKNKIDKIVISVPNAFAEIILQSAHKNEERINTDHRYWFTPYTLAKVVMEGGYNIEVFYLCNSYFKLSYWQRKRAERNPLYNHTIVMVADL